MRPTFANWIPEVLSEIEALAASPRPPGASTIQRARTVIVNESAGRARPQVETAADPDGEVAIVMRWPSRHVGKNQLHDYILVCPGGDPVIAPA